MRARAAASIPAAALAPAILALVVLVLAVMAVLAALPPAPGGAAPPGVAGARGPAATQCGPAAAETLATTAGAVAQRIYVSEASSSETAGDKHQIESDRPLLSAVQSGDRAAIMAAVTRLVFSHTHIVRLRVSRGSALLADVGGPYILAPVGGTLRSRGRTIGRYSFSVQDDLGYVKLVTRFIGAPLILRTSSGQVPVEGLLSPGPASIPDHGPVDYRGTSYEAYSFRAAAYPSGRLRVSLLLPVPRSLSAMSCARIKATETGLVAQRISRRFKLSRSSFAPYIRLVRTLTHGLVFVRAGSRTIAGSIRPGPSHLPSSGALRYHGVNYEVASFAAPTSAGSVRVYVLVGR
jgi:hypothetical protein